MNAIKGLNGRMSKSTDVEVTPGVILPFTNGQESVGLILRC